MANAGVCALEAGDTEMAEAALRQALQWQPEEPLALISMARLEWKRGNALSARGFLQRREAVGALGPLELPVAISVETLAGDRRARERYERQLAELMGSSAEDASPEGDGNR